jgi:Uma2 family endonuclease
MPSTVMAQTIFLPALTVKDYIAGELTSDIRHEYLAGDVYAMVGASDAHNLISGNIFSALHQHLRGGPCQVFMADMKVRLRIAADEYFYYPDILVSCSPDDRATYYREHPSVLIEVLSDSTARVDRREKLLAYQHIPSLEQYVLVGQNQHELTIFRRAANWASEKVGQDGDLVLQSLDFRMSVADIYSGV